MPYKFQIRRKPGRAAYIAADLLLALACFGALQTLGTPATATSVAASPVEPAGVEQTAAAASSSVASLSSPAPTQPDLVDGLDRARTDSSASRR